MGEKMALGTSRVISDKNMNLCNKTQWCRY